MLMIQREKALELRPLLLLGVVCYVNSKIVGAKPTEVDESSNHVSHLFFTQCVTTV
jgi:hypothetical protein